MNVLGPSRATRPSVGPVRILVVEGDLGAARLIASELQKEGLAVDLRTAGDEGEGKATASKYDVIVLERARTPSPRLPRALDTLIAGIAALLRGSRVARVGEMSVADLTLDPASRQVMRAGVQTALTPKECAILHMLMLSAGEVVSRTQLAERIWEKASQAPGNLIDVHVSHLRRKLARSGSAPLIHTIHGVGYKLGLEEP